MSALVQQPDGKLVAAGSGAIVGTGLNFKSAYFALVRYSPDGSLDTSFGSGGKVTTPMGRLSSASALVRQPDGKLIVGGVSGSNNSNGKIALVRYQPDGSLDTTFGHGGKVTTALGVPLSAISAFLVRQPDGKLVAFSMVGGANFVVVRYKTDGTLDTAFGRRGVALTPLRGPLGGLLNPSALVLQPDGKLVAAAGTSSAGASGGFVLVRYKPDGSIDTTFGHGGQLTAAGTTENDINEGLVVFPNGELVAAGAGSYSALTLAAYTKNGKPDTSFGRHGKVTTVLSHVGSISYNGALTATPTARSSLQAKRISASRQARPARSSSVTTETATWTRASVTAARSRPCSTPAACPTHSSASKTASSSPPAKALSHRSSNSPSRASPPTADSTRPSEADETRPDRPTAQGSRPNTGPGEGGALLFLTVLV